MIHRRAAIHSMAAAAMATPLAGCGEGGGYEQAVRETWRAHDAAPAGPAQQHEWVRCATLAANGHNTQPWRFALAPDAVEIEPDLARRTPVVDPDDHHLWVSLGCAAENLVQAAAADGRSAAVALAGGRVRIALGGAPQRRPPLFAAIAERQSTRADYDGQALAAADLHLLEAAAAEPGVHLMLLPSRPRIERVVDLLVAGNTAQLADAAFVAELKAWIRFSAAEAQSSGDGLFSGASGSPVMPRWLGSPLMGLFLAPKSDNDHYARQIRSSSGMAVFVSEADDRAHWIEVGRCYERFALQATALGIRYAFLNQPVEVGSIRPQFAAALGIGSRRPDLVVRFGRGPAMPLSMRRPVSSVLA